MNWSIVHGVSIENGWDFAPQTATVDLSCNLDMKEFKANLGFKGQPSQVDFSTEAIYAPTFFNCFNAGFDTVFHTVYYSDLFYETDFLTGFYLAYNTKKSFECSLSLMYMGKVAHIFAISDSVPWLNNNSFAFKTDFNYHPVNKLDIFISVSSFSQYRYMLYLAPDFKLGGEYHFDRQLSLGGQIEIQYIDMFTLSSNLNSIDLSIYGRLSF